MTTVSVVGCGNMGSALVKGLASADNHTVIAYDVDERALESVSKYCSSTTTDLEEVREAPIVVVAVKPGIVGDVVESLELTPEHTLVSFAAGVPTNYLEERTDATVVRVMPNLAAESGEMAAAVAGPAPAEVQAILADVGSVVEIDESHMDVATAVNGSGPAFVFYLIAAMRDAGVDSGLDPADAEILAAQTFKGAAQTVLDAETSIADLIDAVCSPKGTTIEGMAVLRDSDVRHDVAAAIAAAQERSRELSKETYDDRA